MMSKGWPRQERGSRYRIPLTEGSITVAVGVRTGNRRPAGSRCHHACQRQPRTIFAAQFIFLPVAGDQHSISRGEVMKETYITLHFGRERLREGLSAPQKACQLGCRPTQAIEKARHIVRTHESRRQWHSGKEDDGAGRRNPAGPKTPDVLADKLRTDFGQGGSLTPGLYDIDGNLPHTRFGREYRQ